MKDHTGRELTKAGEIINKWLLAANDSLDTQDMLDNIKNDFNRAGIFYHNEWFDYHGSNYARVCRIEYHLNSIGAYYAKNNK